MRSILACTALVVALVWTGVRAQAGLTGKWQGETRNGATIVLDLTVDKTELTGTLTRNGQPAAITDGKISKNTFTFKATINDQTEALSGELDGDQVKVWLDRQGKDTAIVLKRVKS